MSVIYLVHCVDTEGPLYESLDATAERLEKAFGISVLPSPTLLEDVRAGKGIPEKILPQVNEFLSRISYNKDWGMIDEMLDDMLSDKWRNKHVDDFGMGYSFNWFVMDHVGFESNPRRRSMGYHSIYDYYRSRFDIIIQILKIEYTGISILYPTSKRLIKHRVALTTLPSTFKF